MKKIDLHVHTVKTISDSEFSFSMERLVSYVHEMRLDAIAITNHNIFDKTQFVEICDALEEIKVFPGIELNIGANVGHLLLITESSDIDEFSQKCNKVEKIISNATDSLSLEEFKKIFGNLKKYLLIPHYDKTPRVDKSIISALGDTIIAGEVSSPKKFIYCKKNDGLTPVIFSDWRPVENGDLPIRQTYIDTGSISIKAIKKSLMDKAKVHLTDEEGHHMFQALPDLRLSSGLSVIIGGRSSGKTYTLDQIERYHETVKYIRQFSLLEKEPEKAEEDFSRDIESQYSQFIQEYLRSFSLAVSEVAEIDIAKDEKKIDEYIKSLIKYASETERADAFSRCKLFAETEYTVEDLSLLEELISAVDRLLSARKYKDLIEKNIEREKFVCLYQDLIKKHIEEDILLRKKTWVNELITNIKAGLQSKTSATRIKWVDFYSVQMNRKKVRKFEELTELVETNSVIKEVDIEGFKIQITKRKYNGALELKNKSGKKIAFKDAYDVYGNSAYGYLRALMGISGLQDKDYYQFFVKVECKILNQYGYPVSGGERAEFNLLREINDALQYDLLLIDEPESSFDNIFLKSKVNHLIKEISETMPVVIVTHNNTVGASIRPDYIVHTKRRISNGAVKFIIYSGYPGDHELVSSSGETIPNIEATMDCLEAGRDAYDERRKDYEMLED